MKKFLLLLVAVLAITGCRKAVHDKPSGNLLLSEEVYYKYRVDSAYMYKYYYNSKNQLIKKVQKNYPDTSHTSPAFVDSTIYSYDSQGNMVKFIWTFIYFGYPPRIYIGNFKYVNNIPVSGSFTDNVNQINDTYHYVLSDNKITAIINQVNDTVQKFVYKGDDAVLWIQPNDTIKLTYDNNKNPLFNTDNKWMLVPRIFSTTYLIPVGGMHNILLKDETYSIILPVRNSYIFNNYGFPTHADNHILDNGWAYETVDYTYINPNK